MIRDAAAGERAVKAGGTYYLPALEGMEPGDYNTFRDRGTYYNFTGRTVSASTVSPTTVSCVPAAPMEAVRPRRTRIEYLDTAAAATVRLCANRERFAAVPLLWVTAI